MVYVHISVKIIRSVYIERNLTDMDHLIILAAEFFIFIIQLSTTAFILLLNSRLVKTNSCRIFMRNTINIPNSARWKTADINWIQTHSRYYLNCLRWTVFRAIKITVFVEMRVQINGTDSKTKSLFFCNIFCVCDININKKFLVWVANIISSLLKRQEILGRSCDRRVIVKSSKQYSINTIITCHVYKIPVRPVYDFYKGIYLFGRAVNVLLLPVRRLCVWSNEQVEYFVVFVPFSLAECIICLVTGRMSCLVVLLIILVLSKRSCIAGSKSVQMRNICEP